MSGSFCLTCGAELGLHMACSCSGWALAAACEHTCFSEALDLPNKPATRCIESLPAKKKPGPQKVPFGPCAHERPGYDLAYSGSC